MLLLLLCLIRLNTIGSLRRLRFIVASRKLNNENCADLLSTTLFEEGVERVLRESREKDRRIEKSDEMPLLQWLLKPVVLAVFVAGAAGTGWVKLNQDKIDRFFMGVFRDLGRYKARKRRHAVDGGLSPLLTTLMRQDDPMLDLQIDVEDEDESNLPTYTKAELWEFGNGEDEKILISLFGRVYDVSEGEKFYGIGGRYSMFAGRDVTYSLSTGCKTKECLEKPAKELQDEKDIKEGKRWLSFFHLHDKYHLAGKMDGIDVDELVSKMVTETLQEEEPDPDDPDRIQSEEDAMKPRSTNPYVDKETDKQEKGESVGSEL